MAEEKLWLGRQMVDNAGAGLSMVMGRFGRKSRGRRQVGAKAIDGIYGTSDDKVERNYKSKKTENQFLNLCRSSGL